MSSDLDFGELDGLDEFSDMGSDTAAAVRILPAWFVARMMQCDLENHWGLLTVSGAVIHVSGLYAVRRAANGSVWMTVHLCPSAGTLKPDIQQVGAEGGGQHARTVASVCADHIVAAFSLEPISRSSSGGYDFDGALDDDDGDE